MWGPMAMAICLGGDTIISPDGRSTDKFLLINFKRDLHLDSHSLLALVCEPGLLDAEGGIVTEPVAPVLVEA
jgi:hypothetical protein